MDLLHSLGWQAFARPVLPPSRPHCLLGGFPGPSVRASSKVPGLFSIIAWLSAAVASNLLIVSAGEMRRVGGVEENERGGLEHSVPPSYLERPQG